MISILRTDWNVFSFVSHLLTLLSEECFSTISHLLTLALPGTDSSSGFLAITLHENKLRKRNFG